MTRTIANLLADDVLNLTVGRAASNIISETAANRWLAAFTVAPGLAGTGGTEAAGGAYARIRCDTAFTTAPAGATTRSIANSTLIAWPEATASWGTIVAIGIYDAATAGNLLHVIALDSSVLVDDGTTLYFAVGALTIELA